MPKKQPLKKQHHSVTHGACRGLTASADRKAASIARHSAVDRRECADPKRRKRLEKNPVEWLRYYLDQAFYRPFEKPHLEIIEGAMNAHRTHGRFGVAAERGIGKSVVLWGCILYLKLSDQQPFPVCVPWADPQLKRAFRFWKTALCFNKRLADDYPEYCDPFRHSRGVAQRVMTTTWADTGLPTGAQLTVGDGIIVLPSGLGGIGGSTVNGNIRGLNMTMEDGRVLRPSIVLLDDVQDRKVAASVAQTNDTISIIDSDVGGCGEAGRDLPMLMACNCIRKDDVTSHYMQSKEWHFLRVSCVEVWPDGFEDKQSACRQLWEEWYDLFRGGTGDIEFYTANRDVMTKGMVLSCPSVFAGADNCPDAFYGVMRMYFKMGHEAFMAERQQMPIDRVADAGPYTLTPTTIQSRSTNRPRFERPEWVNQVIASTDVNPSYALSTVLQGFGGDQSCGYLNYELRKIAIPSGLPEPEFNRRLFDELAAYGKALSSTPLRPDVWGIDAGGSQFDAVVRFCGESVRICGIQAVAMTGRGWKNYRPYGKTMVAGQKREQCHGCLDRKDGRVIRWVAWNSDSWKEVAQKAWLGDIGAPGAASLFAGLHPEFSTQFCGEKLISKGDVGGQTVWIFNTVPGKHDFLDAAAQGYALAAYNGIGTGGEIIKQKPKVSFFVSRPSQHGR